MKWVRAPLLWTLVWPLQKYKMNSLSGWVMSALYWLQSHAGISLKVRGKWESFLLEVSQYAQWLLVTQNDIIYIIIATCNDPPLCLRIVNVSNKTCSFLYFPAFNFGCKQNCKNLNIFLHYIWGFRKDETWNNIVIVLCKIKSFKIVLCTFKNLFS